VPDLAAHAVDPSDEQRHPPETAPLWNESYYLDFVAADGAVAGYARIGLYPNLGVTWWTAMVVGADRPVIASVAYDLPVVAGAGLEIGSDGYHLQGSIEDPLEVMALRSTAPGAVLTDPAAVYRGEPGEATTVELDLVWTTDGTPYHYDLTTRYEVPCLVNGHVTVGGTRMEVDGHGQRDHSWGVRDWWAFGWCWASARLDDGTRVHFADIRMPGLPVAFGYLQPPGGPVIPVESIDMAEVLGSEGLPDRATAVLDPGGLELDIEPIAFGPLLLVAPDRRTSRFPRAAARFVARDGRAGTGWIEWNQPDAPDARDAPAPDAGQ
jgi:hypothetical protein